MAVSSSNTTRSPSAATSRGDKHKKQAKIVVLKLSPKLLQRFEPPSAKEEDESTPSSASSPAPVAEDVATLKVPDINDNASESNSTPAPSNGDTNASDPSKKRKGPAPGYKRSLVQMMESNGTPKPRGKPGPKKKPRLYVTNSSSFCSETLTCSQRRWHHRSQCHQSVSRRCCRLYRPQTGPQSQSRGY